MQVKAISACPDTDSTTLPEDVAGVFSQMYAGNFDRLQRVLALRLGRNSGVAEDLAQATFVRLWERMAFKGLAVTNPERSFGLILKMSTEVVADHFRSQSRRPVTFWESWDDESSDEAVKAAGLVSYDIDLIDARLFAGQIITGLPQDARRVLALHLLEDLSVPQVATATGLTRAQVSAAVDDGLRQLRARLGVREEDIAAASAQRREAAHAAYLESVKSGRPLSHAALGTKFGMCASWGARIVRKARGGVPAPRTVSALDAARATLRRDITAGLYPPGTPVTSSEELAREWGTNSATVAKALRDLAAEGLLTRDARRRFVVPAGDERPDPSSTPRGRVASFVRAQIQTGAYPPGAALPSGPVLAQALGVSHPTVREVLADLTRDGILIRRNSLPHMVADPATSTPPPAPARIPAPRRSPESLAGAPVLA